jgi:hypothetical protein
MASKKISRNDPCPCGSGKKFKACCYGKGIDWEARQAAATRRPLPPALRPRTAPPPDLAALGPYRVVDAKLKEVAKASPGPANWKTLVERLWDATPDGERIEAYKAVREAGVLPDDDAGFLFGHAIQWMPSDAPPDVAAEEDDFLDQHTVVLLRRFKQDDLADLYVDDRLEYDRRYERGRQFFFGPPDEELAKRLRAKGVID